MAQQLPLDLPVRVATGRDAFLVAPANALALKAVDGWRNWPSGRLALVGPEGSGKSHLAAVWADEADGLALDARDLPDATGLDRRAVVIEGGEGIAGDSATEERMLHLHNHVVGSGGRLLITGRTAPARWPVGLADLASRLRAIPLARLEPPDDALLAALLVKLFEDRQLNVTPDLVSYLVPRMERSFAAAQNIVVALDAYALAKGRRLGPRLAAEVLDADGRAST
ncbi:MAG: DnaA/Hda family protein [Pseudomonadota bacterium]